MEPPGGIDVQSLRDDEIRAILTSHGEPNTPVNSSTRSILLRKVDAILKRGGAQSNHQVAPPSSAAGDKNGELMETERRPQVDIKKVVIEHQNTKQVNSISSEKANTFPSLATPELSRFRKCIEGRDVEEFVRLVWENPRYLIGRGDTPEILKPPQRYNALHCAVRSGCLPIIKKLFEILEGDYFWSLVYPDDHPDVRSRRRNFLIDLYLNTCDKGVSGVEPTSVLIKEGCSD